MQRKPLPIVLPVVPSLSLGTLAEYRFGGFDEINVFFKPHTYPNLRFELFYKMNELSAIECNCNVC